MSRTMAVFQRFDIIFRFSKDYHIHKKSLELVHNYSDEIIAAKRKELREPQDDNKNDDDERKKKIFLDCILNTKIDGKTFSLEAIRGEVDTLMFAVIF